MTASATPQVTTDQTPTDTPEPCAALGPILASNGRVWRCSCGRTWGTEPGAQQ